MALDHSRLGLENKSGRICLLYKILPANPGVCKPTFYFLYIISEMKQYYEALYFFIQTAGRIQYLKIFQDKLYSVNIQDDLSWAFSETVQNLYKITYTFSLF